MTAVWHRRGPRGAPAPDAPAATVSSRRLEGHNRSMHRRAALALSACLLSAACSADPEPSATSGTSRPDTPASSSAGAPAGSPSPVATGAAPASPAFAADTSRDVGESTGGPLTVTAVRVARQDGYDRVVFELGGEQEGQPGWRVEYVDDPRRDGSGDPVEVAGDATLVVLIDGVGYPDDTGEQEARSARVPADAEVVREVELGAVFEGTYEAFVGTTAQKPFRVFRLADPARVVVDVRHD